MHISSLVTYLLIYFPTFLCGFSNYIEMIMCVYLEEQWSKAKRKRILILCLAPQIAIQKPALTL